MCACACVRACVRGVRACVGGVVVAVVTGAGRGGGGQKACGNINMEGRAARNPLLKVKQSL